MKNAFRIIWICICAFFTVQFNGKPAGGPMAIIKMGQIVAEARGKIAGMVFSRNTAGAYIRQKVSPIQPRTVAQLAVRAFLSSVSQSWRNLTDNSRLTWRGVAALFTHANVYGDNVPLTAFGLYNRLNRNLQEIGEALITDPPAQTAVASLDTLTLAIDNAEVVDDDKIQIAFTAPIPADQKLVVYATPPLSAGVNFVKSEYRKLTVLDVADVTPVSLGDVYIALFGMIPAVGSKAFIKTRPVQFPTGLDGTEKSDSDIAV